MSEAWLEEAEWARIQQAVPIVCVDVLSLRFSDHGLSRHIEAVGLILRDTPHQGQRWCLIGGRVLRGESLGEAVGRQMHSALGHDIHFSIEDAPQPLYVAQYFPARRADLPVDPRKHAVAMTYALGIAGTPVAQNEALEFAWFDPSHLPPRRMFGFEQDRVMASCMLQLSMEAAFDAG